MPWLGWGWGSVGAVDDLIFCQDTIATSGASHRAQAAACRRTHRIDRMGGSKNAHGAATTSAPAKKSTSTWSKLTAYQSKPTEETFPELPDILIWLRIVLGVFYGISLGLRNQVGWVGILFALNVTTMLPTVYVSAFLGADPDKFKQGLTFVGVPNAMATCLLVWIIVFTHQHEEEESAFARAVVQKVADVVTAATAGGEGGEGNEESTAGGGDSAAETAGEGPASVEDTEF